jgi:predicted dehydrogenase
MTAPLRIGIVGARGIGKHHAKWFARAGCEVTAVYGTSEASAGRAAAGLRELFGFNGRAFHDWERFRREGGFDACAVCSPAEAHRDQVIDLAADGRHILCEKPLAWDWNRSPLELIEDATRMVEAAAHHGVILGMNAQYPAGIPGWEELHRRVLGRDPEYRSINFTLETKGAPRSPHGSAEVWVDLGPHPLAVLDALSPGGVEWDTLRCTGDPREAVVDFEWVTGQDRLPVHIECRRTADGSLRRRVGNQDFAVDYGAGNFDGEFRACLRAGDEQWVGSDFMQVSVERFIEAVRTGDERRLLVGPAAALRQQEALVEIWRHCWR